MRFLRCIIRQSLEDSRAMIGMVACWRSVNCQHDLSLSYQIQARVNRPSSVLKKARML